MTTEQYNECTALIIRIKKRLRIAFVLVCVSIVVLILLSGSVYINLGVTEFNYRGIPWPATVFLILVVLLLYAIAWIAIRAPLAQALDVECDPEKYYMLFFAFATNKTTEQEKNIVNFMLAFCKGDFRRALDLTYGIVDSKNPRNTAYALFSKARTAFFLNDPETLRQTTVQFRQCVNDLPKLKPREVPFYQQMSATLGLLIGIADGKLDELPVLCENAVAWRESKQIHVQLSYYKGLAAQLLGNREEAVYRFMFAKENGAKTVFAALSEERLKTLRTSDSPVQDGSSPDIHKSPV